MSIGRTDFPQGDSTQLYRGVQEKLFALPDETRIYPGHDYKHRFVSTIAQEKKRNPRLGSDKTLEESVNIMDNLNLPSPAMKCAIDAHPTYQKNIERPVNPLTKDS